MRRTVLIMFGVLLILRVICSMALGVRAQSQLVGKAYFRRDISDYRGSYNPVGPISCSASTRSLRPIDSAQ